MLPQVQLFRYDHPLTACALGEPSLTLVRNDTDFGLLISDSAHEDPHTGRLHLEGVAYLHVSGRHSSYRDFSSVALYQREDSWFAQDEESGLYFPNPSLRPYHVVFISAEEYQRIRYSRAEGLAYPVFTLAQQYFGKLPHFSYRAKSLETPADYATRHDALPRSAYVLDV